MLDKPLPPTMARVWGNNADLRFRGNGEWSSACPHCNPGGRGGRDPSDRFRMFSEGGPERAWCRSCDHKSLARKEAGEAPSYEDLAAAKEKYVKWLEEENKKLREKVRWLQEADFWHRWHLTMGKDAREIWHDRGIDDYLIEAHQLGYTIERYQNNGGALTIPYIHLGKIQTLQFRLMIPPDTGDKYRFESGTKATWFYPYPHDEIGDVVLVAEGAVKSMVLWQTIAMADKFTYRGVDVTVIASPSKHIPNKMIDELDQAKIVIMMLDPDAYDKTGRDSAIERNARAIGQDKCRHIRTMDKIDDMIMEHDLGHAWIQGAVDQANPVILADPNRKATTQYL